MLIWQRNGIRKRDMDPKRGIKFYRELGRGEGRPLMRITSVINGTVYFTDAWKESNKGLYSMPIKKWRDLYEDSEIELHGTI